MLLSTFVVIFCLFPFTFLEGFRHLMTCLGEIAMRAGNGAARTHGEPPAVTELAM